MYEIAVLVYVIHTTTTLNIIFDDTDKDIVKNSKNIKFGAIICQYCAFLFNILHI